MNWIASSLHYPLLLQPLGSDWGFGLQPACISWPKGFGKIRHCFQSNEEKQVRVIQICESNEWYTTLMVNNENKKKQNGGKKERQGLCHLGLIQPICLEPRRWTAWWCGSQLFFFCSSLFLHAFPPPTNCPGVRVTEAPSYLSTLYVHLRPQCLIWPINKPLVVVYFRSLKSCVPSVDFSSRSWSWLQE